MIGHIIEALRNKIAFYDSVSESLYHEGYLAGLREAADLLEKVEN